MSETSTYPSKELKVDSKTNPFLQWVPPDFLQPIHKFLTRGPFCDPYQQRQQEESDSESDDDHDTTTATAIVVEHNVKTTETDDYEEHFIIENPSNSSTTRVISSEDESHEATPTMDPSLPESTQQREVLPIIDEDVSDDPDVEEEVEIQLSQDFGVEISFNDHHQLRSRPFSDDAASQESVARLVQGDDVTNDETPTSLVASQLEPDKCSDARTIVKFFLFWVGLLLVSVILQPGSIYDSKWFLHRFQQTKTTVQTQVQECGAFLLAGKVDTECALEILQNTMKTQVASCHAYLQGETDTSCWVKVSSETIATQLALWGNAVQDGFHSIHNTGTLQVSKCQTFFRQQHSSETSPTGCILEPPYHWVHQRHEWIRSQVQNVLDYSNNQVHACHAYWSQENQSPTDCFLEDVVVEWNNLQQRTNTKLESTQKQLLRQYIECQQYLRGSTTATDCVLETAQRELNERLEWLTTKISDLPKRIRRVASFYYGNTFQGTTTTAVVDGNGAMSSKSDTIPQEQPPSSSSTKISATESLRNGSVVQNHNARPKKPKQHDLSYFDHLQPIPQDQIPPRSAFKVEKKRGSHDPVQKSRSNESVVHHHSSNKETDTTTTTTTTHVGDKIEHNPTIINENPSQNESPPEIHHAGVEAMDGTSEDASSKANVSTAEGSSNPISSATTTTTTTPVIDSKEESETWMDDENRQYYKKYRDHHKYNRRRESAGGNGFCQIGIRRQWDSIFGQRGEKVE